MFGWEFVCSGWSVCVRCRSRRGCESPWILWTIVDSAFCSGRVAALRIVCRGTRWQQGDWSSRQNDGGGFAPGTLSKCFLNGTELFHTELAGNHDFLIPYREWKNHSRNKASKGKIALILVVGVKRKISFYSPTGISEF